MPNERPLTFAEVLALHYCLIVPDDPDDSENKFRDVLNQVLESIYGDAIWEGTKKRQNVDAWITDNVLTLDYEFDAALAIMIDGNPTTIFEEEFEFSKNGPGEQKAGEGGLAVLDLGFAYQNNSTVQERMVRSYKFAMDVTNFEVEALLKKRAPVISTPQDLVVPSNIRALKLAIMAVNYEDEGDLESSEDYWNKAYTILNAEKQTQNIGVTKTPPHNPWGILGEPPENLM